MPYSKEVAYRNDHCINSKTHRLDVILEGIPMCDKCFGEELERRVKEFEKEREKNESKRK